MEPDMCSLIYVCTLYNYVYSALGCPLRIILYTPSNSTQSWAGTVSVGDDVDALSWMNDNKWVSRIRSFAKHIVVLLQQRCIGTARTTNSVLGCMQPY